MSTSSGDPDAGAATAPGRGETIGGATRTAPADPRLAHADTLASPAAGGRDGRLARGARVGRYVIGDRLGAGGMGEVYAAEDPELRRGVAIKVVRAGHAGSAAGQERFEREAQAMAQLSHPNVVPVYDVGRIEGRIEGQIDGRMFLAMERVDGGTLRGWLAQRRSWREVNARMVEAARGLAAAHAKGIVHRDFKPENVLLDGDGRARVTDFGLARFDDDGGVTSGVRAAEAAGSETLTAAGSLLGTPAYMAPEQRRGEVSDARADQYSLCLTWLEALSGARPTPAQAVTTSAPGPRAILRILRRGLAEDPSARWPSVAALIAAVEAVQRRRRWLAVGGAATALAGGAVAVALGVVGDAAAPDGRRVCATAAAPMAAVWNDDARAAITRAFDASGSPDAAALSQMMTRALDRHASAWTAARIETCEATHVHHVQSAEALDLRVACLDIPLVRARTLVEELRTADRAVVEAAVGAVSQLGDIAGCRDVARLRTEMPLPADAAQAARVAALRAELEAIAIRLPIGRAGGALEQIAQVATAAEAASYPPLVARATALRGVVELYGGEVEAGAHHLEAAIRLADAARFDDLRLRSLVDLAEAQARRLDQPEAALRSLDDAEAVLSRIGAAATDDQRAVLAWSRGVVLGRLQRFDEAIAAMGEGLARMAQLHDPRIGMFRYELAALHMMRAELDRAQPMMERARDELAATYGERSIAVAMATNALAQLREARGDRAGAIAAYEQAIAISEERTGPDDASLATPLLNLAVALAGGGDAARAEALLRRSLAIRERVSGATSARVATARERLAHALALQGRHDEARAQTALALDVRRGIGVAAELAVSLRHAADRALDASRARDALAAATEARALWRTGEGSPVELALIDLALGRAERALGRPARARPHLERAVEVLAAQPGPDAARGWFALAQALWDGGGDRARARALADQARARLAEPPGDAAGVAAVEAWLAARR